MRAECLLCSTDFDAMAPAATDGFADDGVLQSKDTARVRAVQDAGVWKPKALVAAEEGVDEVFVVILIYQ